MVGTGPDRTRCRQGQGPRRCSVTSDGHHAECTGSGTSHVA
jgi:hypothetical protein